MQRLRLDLFLNNDVAGIDKHSMPAFLGFFMVKVLKRLKPGLLLWMLLLNILAITIFGGRYLYSLVKDKQEQHKQAAVAANTMVMMGEMNTADATHLMEVSNDIEHGAKLSDTDLDWCLGKLEGQETSSRSALYRRQDIDLTLSEAVNVLTPTQKAKLYQALVKQMAGDNPNEEIGIDVGAPAHILGKLGDRRAIPMLEAHLNDPRPRVHKTVQKAINRLEGKPIT